METAYDVRGNAVIPAGEKALLSVEIEEGAMDHAERFEMWLDVCKTESAEKQEASAALRDHYFVATLTENDTDGEEANGYLSAWAFDAQGHAARRIQRIAGRGRTDSGWRELDL